jgi:hypothetical protein
VDCRGIKRTVSDTSQAHQYLDDDEQRRRRRSQLLGGDLQVALTGQSLRLETFWGGFSPNFFFGELKGCFVPSWEGL